MGIFNAFATMAQTIANQKIAEDNYNLQKEAYNWNKQFQQSQFDYQKELNNLQMEREDNAIQRSAKDYQAAGFNKLLAAGTQGSASGGMTTFSGGGNLTAPQREAIREQIQFDEIAYAQQAANVGQTRAQTQLLKAQATNEQVRKDNIEMNTLLQEAQKANTVEQLEEIKARIDKLKKENDVIDHNLGLAREKGLVYGVDTRFSNPYEMASNLLELLINYKKNGGKGTPGTGNEYPAGHGKQSTKDGRGYGEDSGYNYTMIQRAIKNGYRDRDIIAKFWDIIPGKDFKEKHGYIIDVKIGKGWH